MTPWLDNENEKQGGPSEPLGNASVRLSKQIVIILSCTELYKAIPKYKYLKIHSIDTQIQLGENDALFLMGRTRTKLLDHFVSE